MGASRPGYGEAGLRVNALAESRRRDAARTRSDSCVSMGYVVWYAVPGAVRRPSAPAAAFCDGSPDGYSGCAQPGWGRRAVSYWGMEWRSGSKNRSGWRARAMLGPCLGTGCGARVLRASGDGFLQWSKHRSRRSIDRPVIKSIEPSGSQPTLGQRCIPAFTPPHRGTEPCHRRNSISPALSLTPSTSPLVVSRKRSSEVVGTCSDGCPPLSKGSTR